MKYVLTVLLVCALSFSVQAAEDVEVIKVKDNIHVLISPSGGNVTVSTGEDGTFLIDDQLTGRSEIIEAAARAINDQKIKYILNTHYHFDHAGGNEFFGDKDAVIIAHDNVRRRLSTRQFITYFQKELLPMARAGLPTVTHTNNMTLHLNGDEIQLLHMSSAHTDGDTIARFKKANVIVAGDLIFNGIYPFIDTEHGGSIGGVIDGLYLLLSLADGETTIIPGHGKVMDKHDLQAYWEMLEGIRTNVDALVADGKTLEEAIAAKPTQEFDEKWGKGFIPPDDFVKVVYESLDK